MTVKTRNLLILAIFGAGLFLRFWGLSPDVPEPRDVFAAKAVLEAYEGGAGLVLKGLSLFLSVIFLHKEPSPYPFTIEHVLLISRIASAFLSFLWLPVLFLSLKKLFREKAAILGTFLFSIAFIPIAGSGKPDSVALFGLFVLISIAFSASIIHSSKQLPYLLAGLFAGLAAACDIRGVLAVGAIVAAHLTRKNPADSLKARFLNARLLFSGFSCFAGFLTGRVLIILVRLPGGTTAAPIDFPQFVKRTVSAFASGEGLLFFIAILFGIAGLILYRRDAHVPVFFIFPVLFLAAVPLAGSEPRNDLVVLSPFYAALAGLGIASLLERQGAREVRIILHAAVVLLLAALSARTVVNGYMRWDDDTAAIARRWIVRNLPEDLLCRPGGQDCEPMKVIHLKEGYFGNRPRTVYGASGGASVNIPIPLPEVPWQGPIPREFEILDGSPYGKETKSFRIEGGQKTERIFISRTPLKKIDIHFLLNESDGDIIVRNGFQRRKIAIENGREAHLVLAPQLTFPFHRYRYSIRIKASKDLKSSFVRILPDIPETAGVDPRLFIESKSLFLEAENMERTGGRLVEAA
ncbi:MAG: hypothetical protein SCM96_13370 [Acidobacteriota bacterium]|nr:hypothetical protein [Acidobacteriota bacterium]